MIDDFNHIIARTCVAVYVGVVVLHWHVYSAMKPWIQHSSITKVPM